MLITPWNAPLMLATWKVAPAPAAGNTVILKPAEWSPLTASLLADIAAEAGLPPGVLNVGRRVEAADAAHLPPVVPSKIIAVHLNHRSRVEEFMVSLPPAPTYFHKPTSALNAHRGAVVRPPGCQYLNYEGEVAIVIGRTCRGIAPSGAGEYIAGYTIANDYGLHDFRDTDAGSMLRVTSSEEVVSTAFGGDWEFRGVRPPNRGQA